MHDVLRRLVLFCLAGFAGVCLALPARAQQGAPPDPMSQAAPQNGSAAPPPDSTDQKMLAKMARERNAERQKDLVKDADQLLNLAKELKAEVDKSDKDELSLSVVNTAAKIEKLAKSVKERMRDGE